MTTVAITPDYARHVASYRLYKVRLCTDSSPDGRGQGGGWTRCSVTPVQCRAAKKPGSAAPHYLYTLKSTYI